MSAGDRLLFFLGGGGGGGVLPDRKCCISATVCFSQYLQCRSESKALAYNLTLIRSMNSLVTSSPSQSADVWQDCSLL